MRDGKVGVLTMRCTIRSGRSAVGPMVSASVI